MFDLALIRERLTEVLRAVNGGELNVYAWPDPKPEYPCVQFTWPTEIDYHLTQARAVSVLTVSLSVLVAVADLAEATRRLDEYANPSGARSLVYVLENAKGTPAWSTLTVDRAANWRRLTDIDALAFDIELTLHA